MMRVTQVSDLNSCLTRFFVIIYNVWMDIGGKYHLLDCFLLTVVLDMLKVYGYIF